MLFSPTRQLGACRAFVPDPTAVWCVMSQVAASGLQAGTTGIALAFNWEISPFSSVLRLG